MDLPFGIERRDPVSPILRLGSLLFEANRRKDSGKLEIRDRGRTHEIWLTDGSIADIWWEGVPSAPSEASTRQVWRRVEQIFKLPRPHVLWSRSVTPQRSPIVLSPQSVVISGVTSRQDLFDPRTLAERIPVTALQLTPAQIDQTRHLPLTPQEAQFVGRLRVPSPVPMILWKRGLAPQHAAALLIGLNLVGLWEGTWNAGDLPRLTAAAKTLRRLESGVSDCELLGVSSTASLEEVDRAFRRLSLELHPDRLIGYAAQDTELAQRAYLGANAAYQRIKRSRRQRPVVRRNSAASAGKARPQHQPDQWSTLLSQARSAGNAGEKKRAKAFLLKALALSPPRDVQNQIVYLLRQVA